MHFSGFVPASQVRSLGGTVTHTDGSEDNFTSCFQNQSALSASAAQEKTCARLEECTQETDRFVSLLLQKNESFAEFCGARAKHLKLRAQHRTAVKSKQER